MDAFFLYIEREEEPMTVGCIALFDGQIPFKRFVNHIDSRLHLIPRYLQRVVPAPLNLGMPTWEFDPDFNIKNHIFRVQADPPGDEDALRRLAEQLFQGTLDRSKPLWDIHLVEGMQGDRTGMICRIHHCMVDGVAGIGLMYILFDTSPQSSPVRKEPYKPGAIPDAGQLLYDAVWDAPIESLEHWTRFQKGVADYVKGQDGQTTLGALKEFALTMKDYLGPFQRMPFNKPFSGERKIACGSFSFAEARAIRAACGGTLNDVALTVLSGAVRRYLEHHGESLRKRILRVLVPVNIRTEEERGAMGNRISFLPVEIPIDIKDPVERLRLINETTSHLKKWRVSEAVSLMFQALQGMPAPLQALTLRQLTSPTGQRALGMLYQVPPMHLICTNVPGPQIPLYCVGRRLISSYALLPIALEMGISCGVTSYDQRLFISLIADAAAAPDIDRMMEYFGDTFLELRTAAEVKERLVHEFGRIPEAARSREKDNGSSARVPLRKSDSVEPEAEKHQAATG